jgi:hypothetical protein
VLGLGPQVCDDAAPCCLNQSQWDNLNQFANATNSSLVFGLRAEAGGNVSDTLRLLKYTADAGWVARLPKRAIHLCTSDLPPPPSSSPTQPCTATQPWLVCAVHGASSFTCGAEQSRAVGATGRLCLAQFHTPILQCGARTRCRNACHPRNSRAIHLPSRYDVMAFEYGNEVGCRVGAGLPMLSSLVANAWAARPARTPALIGPDCMQRSIIGGNSSTECTSTFFNGSAGTSVLAFTYHFYLQTSSIKYSAVQLDALGHAAAPITDAVRRFGSTPTPTEVWAGEFGGHSHGGVVGVTDTFASHQWYLDALGLLATLGHTLFVRQDLVGGNYGLLQDNFPFGPFVPRAPTPRSPSPPGWQADNGYTVLADYWATLLWKKLMGVQVLRTVVPITDSAVNTTRVYAHCTKNSQDYPGGGGVTLLVINIAVDAAVVVTPTLTLTARPEVYALTAVNGNVSGNGAALNGVELKVGPDFDVPLISKTNATTFSKTFRVPAQSYTFAVLPGASTLCQ